MYSVPPSLKTLQLMNRISNMREKGRGRQPSSPSRVSLLSSSLLFPQETRDMWEKLLKLQPLQVEVSSKLLHGKSFHTDNSAPNPWIIPQSSWAAVTIRLTASGINGAEAASENTEKRRSFIRHTSINSFVLLWVPESRWETVRLAG